MTTIHDILQEFRQEAESKRDLGDRFERLMQAYFRIDPYYQDLFINVWLWMEYPKRGDAPDTGIDLVAEERATGELWAIQCKFYDPKHTLGKSDLDSFFTASGKKEFTHRLIVATTDNWSENLEKAIQNQQIPVNRLTVYDLANSPIDWSQFSLSPKYADAGASQKVRDTTGTYGLKRTPKKQLRPHQIVALEKVTNGLQQADRGKMIMACGTGKTFTALKIAEQMAGIGGTVLFLVPSISLLSQTLREWTAEAEIPIHPIAVCSDVKVGKKSDVEDIKTSDLPFPATTDSQKVAQGAKLAGDKMSVIFSTYQSIEAIASAQKQGLPEFDLIICDEAHRTTGAILVNKEESQFTRVHNQEYVKGKKRLYMTATPRLYGDQAKTKAQENEIVLCSMDDESLYGKELHRLGFGEAVSSGLLSDYRVLVLAVDEKYVSRTFQRQLAEGSELKLEDAVKIVGCWNGLAKKIKAQEEAQEDPQPTRRAVAFSRSIKDSQTITQLFGQIIEEYKQNHPDEEVLDCALQHIDGTQNSLERNRKLDWLKSEIPQNSCRILSNARCLSEGVDVPALDAVMFLTPRNSQVDVVQSVGRVMRKAEGKKYGYIILPIGIPADMTPEEALKDNDRYRVVWQVLQALRAHDDRFNAIINKLELNNNPPPQVDVIGVGGGQDDTENVDNKTAPTVTQLKLDLPQLEEWKQAIYAKIVVKCGDRRYWEDWAKDVAQIADRHTSRIKALLASSEATHRQAFDSFLEGLRCNLNPSISESDAIEMLSQHLITKPVFDALFEDYQFTQLNPVSIAMQKMLDALEGQSLGKEIASLDKFYASVKTRASGIDNAEGRQKIIIELYDKFFKNAFPRMAERLGIVYTPVEVVDFIVRSADDALRQEFGVGLTDDNVHILDPFTGTGTFMVRLLQNGLIAPQDLERKYHQELHANEIVLLAYYIAAINIEAAFHDLQKASYQPFNGIVLTDTFQMFESQGTLNEVMFPENNQRVVRQRNNDIRVIIGNPPYESGQKSANDNNQNVKYSQLDERISSTYIESSSKKEGKSKSYASEIRALRWASDRIKDRGIVCYISNGSFIDSISNDGLRKCLVDEFTSVYCFNLRGNQRTSGETSRQEGGKIFGSGSRAAIAITLLIKNPEKAGQHQLFYHDIGDYLSREEKLEKIKNFGSFTSINWDSITPKRRFKKKCKVEVGK